MSLYRVEEAEKGGFSGGFGGIFVADWPGNCHIMRHVLLLALDTSSPAGSVAILRDGQIIGVLSTWTDEDYSSRMFRYVEMLLGELSLDLGAFDAYAVTSGPGSFTGLRVGLAAVKGWAEVYEKPIVAVSALEAIAWQSRASTPLIVPVFDARRGEVYFGVYTRQGSAAGMKVVPEAEAGVGTPDDFLAAVQSKVGNSAFTLVTPTIELLTSALERAKETSVPLVQIAVETVASFLAPVVGEIGWQRVRAGEVINSLMLDANYVRRTDAEMKWRDPAR
jgi:tRNA threonylcarbamoyladenosine biosynthesis protein TsaB